MLKQIIKMSPLAAQFLQILFLTISKQIIYFKFMKKSEGFQEIRFPQEI